MSKTFKRIALIGLDGSGKSANIDRMKTDKDFTNFHFVWVRWKPILLKPAYWILSKRAGSHTKEKMDKPVSNIASKNTEEQAKLNADYNVKSGMKGKIFKNPLFRGIWITMAFVDYFVQFHIKTIALTLGKKDIIFDRFYFDLFVDQGINVGYSPEKIDHVIKKYQWLFPKMKQIVYIRVSPEVCYQRKDDIPNMDYLLRRYEIYETLAKNPNWVTVDGEKAFEIVNGDIKKIVLE